VRARASFRIGLAAIAVTAAGLASLTLATSESLAGSAPPGVANRRGYPKLAILRSGGPPTDPAAVEALHRNFSLADIMIFQGARGKWWPLPTDASGYTLRAYNRKVKILQYLSLDAFPTGTVSVNEIVPPPTDPEAALHTSNFTMDEFYALARATGSTTTYPVLGTLDPKWAGALQKTDYNGRYATWVFANWKSRAFRDYVKSAIITVAAAGFNGMFFDFGALGYLAALNGHWTVMPPSCFRLKSSGTWYWLSLPGQAYEQYGPPPEIDALRATDPAAVDAIQDVEFCATTGAPAEITSLEDAESMIISFYAEMRRASSSMLLVWNGADSERRGQITLLNTHGAHQEGFALRAWTPQQIRSQLDTVELFNAKRKIFIAWNREFGAQGQIYGYVACMMAGGPNTYCEFSDLIPSVAEIQMDPGKPRGHYVTLPAGETDLERIVYKRAWSNTVMYLNPTLSDITVDGITIAAKTGLVLPPPPR